MFLFLDEENLMTLGFAIGPRKQLLHLQCLCLYRLRHLPSASFGELLNKHVSTVGGPLLRIGPIYTSPEWIVLYKHVSHFLMETHQCHVNVRDSRENQDDECSMKERPPIICFQLLQWMNCREKFWNKGNELRQTSHLRKMFLCLLQMTGINFPDAQDSGHMMTMLISNRVFDAVVSNFHVDKSLSETAEKRIIYCNVTQEDLVFQATQNGESDSGTARTLSDSLPDFAAKYPGASVEVAIRSIEEPTVELSGGESIDVCLWVLAILRARLPDGSTVDFLTIEVNVTSTLLLTMEPRTLKGTVAAIKLKSITVVESLLESINQVVLKNVFELISEQFLRRKFKEAAQKGITIPSPLLPGVDAYENVTMTSAGDFIRIDADLKFCP